METGPNDLRFKTITYDNGKYTGFVKKYTEIANGIGRNECYYEFIGTYEIYEGFFRKGKKHGYGREIEGNGRVYTGNW